MRFLELGFHIFAANYSDPRVTPSVTLKPTQRMRTWTYLEAEVQAILKTNQRSNMKSDSNIVHVR